MQKRQTLHLPIKRIHYLVPQRPAGHQPPELANLILQLGKRRVVGKASGFVEQLEDRGEDRSESRVRVELQLRLSDA